MLILPYLIYPECQSGSFERTLKPLSICYVIECDASLENIDRRCNFDPIGPAAYAVEDDWARASSCASD